VGQADGVDQADKDDEADRMDQTDGEADQGEAHQDDGDNGGSPLLQAIAAGMPQDAYDQLYGPPARDPEIGVVLISRYADAVQVLSDGHTFSNRTTLFPVMFQPSPDAVGVMSELFGYPQALATLDGEHHKRSRDVATRAFPKSGRHVAPFLPELLDRLVGGLRERHRADGEVELMEHLASPLVIEVTVRTIGLPDRARGLRDHAIGQSQMVWGDPAPEDQAAFAEDTMAVFRFCTDAVDDVLALDPDERPDTYVTRLLAQGMPVDEVKSNVFGVASASYSTTAFALGNLVVDLLGRDGAWQELHHHPDQIPEAVTRGLSTSTPVFGWLRQVSPDVEGATVGGVALAPGERLLVLLGAANLDPERPAGAPDLTFSTLPHRCLGAAQAQYLLEQALAKLTAELPGLGLSRPVEHYADLSFHGPRALWVSWSGGER
jgi:cytochrome P450